MSRTSWSRFARGAVWALMLGTMLLAEPLSAQDLIKVKMGRLAFPSLSSVLLDIVAAKGLDKKHGVDMEISSFGAVSAYYAAVATGEVEMLAGGPHVFQKMMLEGVPIKIGLTWARLNALAVITGDPAVKSLADLKGKSIAADMGSSEYQILAIYGRTQNLVFGKDITVVQASPALARSQLQANRVEAAMVWEPTVTVAMRDNPQYRIVLTGDQAWQAVANAAGWELVMAMREDFLKRSPAAIPRLLKALQEAQQFLKTNIDEADDIVVSSIKLPKGVLKEGVTSGRIVYDILPAWEGERAVLENMLKIAVDSGYLQKLPPDPIYKP